MKSIKYLAQNLGYSRDSLNGSGADGGDDDEEHKSNATSLLPQRTKEWQSHTVSSELILLLGSGSER